MNDKASYEGQGQGADAGAHQVPTPSERGAEAEPDALHDPVRAEQQGRTARDFGVSGAGASDEVGPLRRPQGAQERGGSGLRAGDPRAAGGPGGRTDAELSEQERGIGHGPGAAARPGTQRSVGGEGGIGDDRGMGGERGMSGERNTGGEQHLGGEHGAVRGAAAGGAGRAGHTSGAEHTGGTQLLPHGERDKLGLRLQQAVNQFVDEPRRAVEEADLVLEEAVRHLTDTLAEHRRTLRGGWEHQDRETETEDLRVALRKYREVTERLLQL
ncbi:hypothetical protein [Streptomyces sp. NPDC058657]|uniref:hypothetical protein n=1 Tax=unclassified Streptomyces TaxID=2593676 RepID=UPI00366151C2